MGALGRRIGDRQDIARAETFNGVILGLNRFARTGYGGHEGTAFLLGTVVDLFDVIDRHCQGRLSYCQGAEFFRNNVVIRIDSAPIDFVRVFGFANFRDGAVASHSDFALIRLYKAFDSRFFIGQWRAVVNFGIGGSSNGHLGRQDLQTAGTDIQAHAVVGVFRQIGQRDRILEIGIIARVGFRKAYIA